MSAPVAVVLVLLGGWKAETANIELPVPKGWRFSSKVYKPSPSVPGKQCVNDLWFDFIPGASLDYAKQLIATESLEVAAVRQWDFRPYEDVELAKRPAVVMRLKQGSVYVVPVEGGVLITQAGARGEKPENCIPLHDELASKLVELFLAPSVQTVVQRIAKTEKPPPLKELEPVPNNLDEALALLEKSCNLKLLAEIRDSADETFMYGLHHSLGRGLRNGWGLWGGGSPIAQYFKAMGVSHAEDMSGIILTSLWRKLHGRPIELEAQAAASRRYWDLRRKPTDLNSCPDGGVAKMLFSLGAEDRVVQVFECDRTTFRAYELDAGWYEPDAKLKKRIETLRRRGNVLSAPLEAAPPQRCAITTGVNLLSRTENRVDAGVILSFDGGEKTEAVLSGGARGLITSGFSARYNEYFAPELLPRVLVIEGRAFPLLTHTTMGVYGGGGEALSVLIAHDGGLTEQVLGNIGGATTINEATELGAKCQDVLRVQGRMVSLSSCFNGMLQPAQCFEWNGNEFARP